MQFERKEGLPCKSKLKSCELCSDISCYAWNPIVFTVRGWILTCLVSTNFFPPPHSTINNQINTAEDFKDKTRPIETKCDVNKSKAGVFSARGIHKVLLTFWYFPFCTMFNLILAGAWRLVLLKISLVSIKVILVGWDIGKK